MFAPKARHRYGPALGGACNGADRRASGARGANLQPPGLAGDYVVDIFDEIDEDLRAEKAQAIFKRYGGLMAGAALALVVGVAGWQGWQWWQQRHDQAASSSFLAAMHIADEIPPSAPGNPAVSEQRARAMAAFAAVAVNSPNGHRSLALLREAGLKADSGDLSGAVSLWDQVAADAGVDPLLRDVANLTSVTRQVDTGDAARLAARIKPMTAADNPWHAMAQEQSALLDIRQGHMDEAKQTLGRLAQDPASPIGVRSRAGALLARLASSPNAGSTGG